MPCKACCTCVRCKSAVLARLGSRLVKSIHSISLDFGFYRGMRILVWQWGRRGAGPSFAVALAEGLRLIPGIEALLSLSTGAEILRGLNPPVCQFPIATYSGVVGLTCRWLQAPLIVVELINRLAAVRPDLTICAMPGPLDLMLLAALRWIGVPVVVIVHDADPHLGDTPLLTPLLMFLQRRLIRRATAIVALSKHVAVRLRQQCVVNADRLFVISHPPFVFGPPPSPPLAHGGPLRLLCFGRLLPYKGLGLLATAVAVQLNVQIRMRSPGSGQRAGKCGACRLARVAGGDGRKPLGAGG